MPFQAVLADNIDDESYPNSEENQHTSAFMARGFLLSLQILLKSILCHFLCIVVKT